MRVGVEAVAEGDLAAEGAVATLGEVHLIAFSALPRPFAGHRQHVALDGHVEAVGGDPGEVEVDPDVAVAAVGVHRHGGRGGAGAAAGELVEESVEFTERAVHDEHR